jgi:aspartate/methionine/tyrosine aminotransferase
MLLRSPMDDDWAFTECLAEENILCLPGEVVELPSYFRISLTPNESMIERALLSLAKVIKRKVER